MMNMDYNETCPVFAEQGTSLYLVVLLNLLGGDGHLDHIAEDALHRHGMAAYLM